MTAAVWFFPRLLCAAASVLLFLTLWIVLPGPIVPLLALAVGAPELCAWLLLGSVLLGALTIGALSIGIGAGASDGWTRAALVLIAIAAALAASPLVRLPFAVRECDRKVRDALGEDYLRDVPADQRAQMRPATLVARDLFRGVDTGSRAHPVRVTRDVQFAAPEGVRLTVDIYGPSSTATATAGPHPTVVQIYGGAWQRGEPGDDAHFATYLAAHGFVVFAIDYRHAPQWKWPAQRDDVRTALAWIGTHAREYDADISRVALIGRSAGAHLALLAAYQPDEAAAAAAAAPVASASAAAAATPATAPVAVPSTAAADASGSTNASAATLRIRAVISYYGPVDLADGYRHPPVPDPLDARAVEEAFLGGTPDQVPDRYRDASPITYVPTAPNAGRALPASLLLYGGRDHVVLARYGAMLDARLRAAGATSVFLELPWAEHAFDLITSGPSAQLSLYYTERFLAWSLRPTSR